MHLPAHNLRRSCCREGERLATVTAAGIHPIGKALAKGTNYGNSGILPFIPGADGVGKLEDGNRVYSGIARSPFGTFSERALAASWMCLPLPEGVDDVTAAGIANPAISSWPHSQRERNSSPEKAS